MIVFLYQRARRLSNKKQNRKSGLNREYIGEGIVRFVSKKYPFYQETAGMVGFVIEKMDIEAINNLLKLFPKTNTDFGYSYYSSHKTDNSLKYIYHLMFDFSRNIDRKYSKELS